MWKTSYISELYEISTDGYVKNKKTQLILKQRLNNGYKDINICKKTTSVHKLVLGTFVGIQEGMNINHKNGVKTDNRLKNLEYISQADNVKHSVENNLIKPFCRKVDQYTLEGVFIQTFNSLHEAGIAVDINHRAIQRVCEGTFKKSKGFIWKYTESKEEEEIPQEMTVLSKYPQYSITRDGKVYNRKF